MSNEFSAVMESVDLLFAEMRELKARGPKLRIKHRFAKTERCAAGEEVAAIYLLHRHQEVWIPLSLTSRLVVDFLGRFAHFPQSARQISAAMQNLDFYRDHGHNAGARVGLNRRVHRASVRVHVQRIRQALRRACHEVNLDIDPGSVLRSHTTTGNEVAYQLKAVIELSHDDAGPGR